MIGKFARITGIKTVKPGSVLAELVPEVAVAAEVADPLTNLAKTRYFKLCPADIFKAELCSCACPIQPSARRHPLRSTSISLYVYISIYLHLYIS